MMKKLTAKETYRRLLFKERMMKKANKALNNIQLAYKKLEDLQNSCPHYDSEYRNRGSGQNLSLIHI
jgi:hypothetical protein